MSKHNHTAGCRKLGARLRRLRKAREWTLQQTADAIGSSKSHVYEMETGRNTNPTIGTVIALARTFQTSIDALVKP